MPPSGVARPHLGFPRSSMILSSLFLLGLPSTPEAPLAVTGGAGVRGGVKWRVLLTLVGGEKRSRREERAATAGAERRGEREEEATVVISLQGLALFLFDRIAGGRACWLELVVMLRR